MLIQKCQAVSESCSMNTEHFCDWRGEMSCLSCTDTQMTAAFQERCDANDPSVSRHLSAWHVPSMLSAQQAISVRPQGLPERGSQAKLLDHLPPSVDDEVEEP